MTALQVCIDARLTPGFAGGVVQALTGLAAGLSALEEGDEEYRFLAYEGAEDWLGPYLRGPCRLWPLYAPESDSGAWLPRPVRRMARWTWHWVSPLLGSRSAPIPISDGRVEAASVDVIHFPTQRGFLTTLPSVYQPWDLQHRHLPLFFTPRERLARELHYRALTEQASAVVTSSQWGRGDLITHFGLPADKILIVAASSPLEMYTEPTPADVDRTRWRHGLREPFLLYPAQTWPHKNHLGLLRTLALLRDRQGLRIPLVCSGRRNDHFARVKQAVHSLRLDDQVTFTGYVPGIEMACLYRLAHALVFPTLFEGLGIPLLEAFGQGVPVACSKVTCLPEVAGDAALLFDPHSTDDMAGAIARVWEEEDTRQLLIERGRARARHVTWEGTARSFRAIYRWIAGRPLSENDRSLLQRAHEGNVWRIPTEGVA